MGGFVMSTEELCYAPARTLARWIRTRRVSATEVMRAFIARIERLNPRVNAIVTFVPEQALRQARALDHRRGKANREMGPLAGLPIAYKDLVPTRGIRTTFGSVVYRDHVPEEDALLVERLKAAGAITLGKTNTPEFGAGSQTYNAVFGTTLNPYDTTKTCGGSSGGAAVAVACGMLPFADGSDLGASLRNPGNFCNVVGFRPSTGRVPNYPSQGPWSSMAELGPIARTASDAALLLAAMAGPDPRAPAAYNEPGKVFLRPLGRDFRRVRVAWSRDLGGLPMDPRVTKALVAQRAVFASLGCIVEEAEPDLSGANEAFRVLRAVAFVQRLGELYRTRRVALKDTVIWNVEEGLRLAPERIAAAEARRAEVYQRTRRFFERYEFLLAPVNQVPPFPASEPWVREIGGTRMNDYLEWMKSCYLITVTGHPAASVPAGFTGDDPPLPVGIQIVGRFRDDFGVLQLAHAFQQANPAWKQRPPIAR
jgi:amidase